MRCFHPYLFSSNQDELIKLQYYLSLDSGRAADKIYIVKKNDEELFNDIIKIMNSTSSNKTSDILKLVRNIELRKDLLFSIYDEIQQEKQNQLKDEITELEKNDILISINEIEKIILSDDNCFDDDICVYDKLCDYAIWLVLQNENDNTPIPAWYDN